MYVYIHCPTAHSIGLTNLSQVHPHRYLYSKLHELHINERVQSSFPGRILCPHEIKRLGKVHYHDRCHANRVPFLEIRAAVKLATNEARVAFSSYTQPLVLRGTWSINLTAWARWNRYSVWHWVSFQWKRLTRKTCKVADIIRSIDIYRKTKSHRDVLVK